MPGKADPEQQKTFFSEVEKPLMEKAQKGKSSWMQLILS